MKEPLFNFQHSYADLPKPFYQKVTPIEPSKPEWIQFNNPLAKELGLNLAIEKETILSYLSGQSLPPNASPIAMAYAGHQFGHFVPQLGDGRTLLLGECITPKGKIKDIQLKGSGQTRFSRQGDGLAPLGAVIREYIVSEAMHQLGIPTTRALSAIKTGSTIYRETITPGGILTRVASSHIRVGTFEYFFYQNDLKNLKMLLDYTLNRHAPSLTKKEDKYLLFFRKVGQRFLKTVAQWMGIGFIHGVMNTDNTALSGETIDFGPCAFLDHFKFNKVFSSIDHHGRYAYANQPTIAIWNLSQLAICLSPFIHENQTKSIALLEKELHQFHHYYEKKWLQVMGEKLGIFKPVKSDIPLIKAFLNHLEQHNLDYTQSFRSLPQDLNKPIPIYQKTKERLEKQKESVKEATHLMNKNNPERIPRNHQIESVIQAAIQNNVEPFKNILESIKNPFESIPKLKEYTLPPKKEEEVTQTFCGT